ncbi:hypothetical protein EV132_101487 [Rhizobium sullae]|uniref:Uncharacterized protein n=1 Tax=Rhizobium sullae TaxID=50338 RepID=A0A4R3QFF7_RHISU|nr:hypothetical protein EV132_101487 [Rhizobium sullae]
MTGRAPAAVPTILTAIATTTALYFADATEVRSAAEQSCQTDVCEERERKPANAVLHGDVSISNVIDWALPIRKA